MVKKVSIFLPEDLHRQLKMKCAGEDTSIQEFALQAIQERLGASRSGQEQAVMPLSRAERRRLLRLAVSITKSGSEPRVAKLLRAVMVYFDARCS
jgi:hypothetical protein